SGTVSRSPGSTPNGIPQNGIDRLNELRQRAGRGSSTQNPLIPSPGGDPGSGAGIGTDGPRRGGIDRDSERGTERRGRITGPNSPTGSSQTDAAERIRRMNSGSADSLENRLRGMRESMSRGSSDG